MKIPAHANANPIPVASLLRGRAAGGTILIPVRPSHYLYSNLKHIKGVPAPNSEGGYSLNKLRAIDNLIGRLKSLGATPPPASEHGSDVDQQLTGYQRELQMILQVRQPMYRGSSIRDLGLAVNIVT